MYLIWDWPLLLLLLGIEGFRIGKGKNKSIDGITEEDNTGGTLDEDGNNIISDVAVVEDDNNTLDDNGCCCCCCGCDNTVDDVEVDDVI